MLRYSKKCAQAIGTENLTKPLLKSYIDERMKEKEDSLIAKQDEVLKYLTKGMRGQLTEEVVVTVGVGDGFSEERIVKKNISIKDSNKCADNMSKAYIKSYIEEWMCCMMATLKNQKQEKFAQCLASGMSQRKAYRAAYPNSEKWKGFGKVVRVSKRIIKQSSNECKLSLVNFLSSGKFRLLNLYLTI